MKTGVWCLIWSLIILIVFDRRIDTMEKHVDALARESQWQKEKINSLGSIKDLTEAIKEQNRYLESFNK